MFVFGKLFDLILVGCELIEKIQFIVDGICLYWLVEGVLEVILIGVCDNGVDLLFLVGIYGNEIVFIELFEWLICKVVVGIFKFVVRVFFLFGNFEVICCGECYVEQDMNCLFNGCYEEGSGNEVFCVVELECLVQVFFSKIE